MWLTLIISLCYATLLELCNLNNEHVSNFIKNEQGSRHRLEPGVISVAISGVSNKDNRVCQNMG